MKHLFSLVGTMTSLMLASTATHAQEPLPYHASFEVSEGFAPGSIDGQLGFSVLRGVADITPGSGSAGSSGLMLHPSSPSGIVQLSLDANLDPNDDSPQVIYTDFQVRPGAIDIDEGMQFADVEGSLTGFFRVDEHGELHLFDGNAALNASGQWIPTGAKFVLDEQGNPLNWLHLAFRQDFTNHLWDVAINGEMFRTNLQMSQARPDQTTIEFIGHPNVPVFIDDIRVSHDALAFSDEDRDGLPDEWERVYQLDDGRADRNDDDDGDGLTNVEELVLSTNPGNPDTDGDGLSDGAEYTAQSDPLTAEGALPTAASSATSASLSLTASSCGETWAGFYLTLNGSLNITDMSVDASLVYPFSQALYSYDWVSNGTGEIWLSTPTYADGGYIHVTVTADNGYRYHGSFGFSCDCSCGCATVWSIGSVDFKIGIGTNDFGRFGQDLVVKESHWSSALYSRHSVRYAGSRQLNRAHQSRIKVDGHDHLALDWVLTDTQFTKLVDLPHGYAVEAYHLDQVTSDHSVIGAPFQRYRVENPDPNGIYPDKRLRITEEGSRQAIREYRFRRSNGVEIWELWEGGNDFETRPLRFTKMTKSLAGTQTQLSPVETELHQQGHWSEAQQALVIDEEKELTYRLFPYGRRLVREVLDPKGQALTTQYGYVSKFQDFDPKTHPAGYAQLKPHWKAFPDGNWEWYGYDSEGRRSLMVRPLGNTPKPDTLPKPGPGYHATLTHIDASSGRETTRILIDGKLERTSTRTSQREGSRIKEITRTHYGKNGPEEVTIKIKDARSHRLIQQDNPDGSLVSVTLQEEGDVRTEVRYEGNSDRSAGKKTVTRTHRSGLQLERTVTDVASGIKTQHERTLDHDLRFRATLSVNEITGDLHAKGYDCCDLSWETRGHGDATRYERDALSRVIGRVEGFKSALDSGNQLGVVTSHEVYALDGKDRRLTTHRLTPDGGLHLQSSTHYNLASQVEFEVDAGGTVIKQRTLMLPSGGRLELTSHPISGEDRRHRIHCLTFAADGTLVQDRLYASRQPFATEPDPGTSARSLKHESGRDHRGRYQQVTDIAGLFDQRIRRTYLNAHDQPIEVIHALGTPLEGRETFDYNARHQLIRHVDPDGITTRYTYNEEGDRHIEAVDLDVQPGEKVDHIDFAVDRITRTTTAYAKDPLGFPVFRRRTEIFTAEEPRTTLIVDHSLDGKETVTLKEGQRTQRRRSDGETPGSWQITETKPDGSRTVAEFREGRQVRHTRYDANDQLISWTERSYTALGRLDTLTDSRTGTTHFVYDPYGRRIETRAPNPSTASSDHDALVTQFTYDALGQLVKTIKPGGGTVTRSFLSNGKLHQVAGHHTIPVRYDYNGRGERTGMTTFYGNGRQPSHTRWHYNALGLLQEKTDAKGNGVRYTYTPGGKLKSRVWARGVKTTYHYDSRNHVDLRSIEYSDSTPNLHYTYDREGRHTTIQDAGGHLELRYQGASLASEQRTGPSNDRPQFFYGEAKHLTYLRDHLGRLNEVRIGHTASGAEDYAVHYRYDGASRLHAVRSQGYEFRYHYLEHSTSDQLYQIEAPFLKETEFAYEPGRDRLLSVTNRIGFNLDHVLSQYRYEHDAHGAPRHRTAVTPSATTRVEFTYDPNTGGIVEQRPSIDFPGAAHFAYTYDESGNRLSSIQQRMAQSYHPNALNQYEQIASGERQTRLNHDADGNLIQQGAATYHWDGENRLREIRIDATPVARYQYDYRSRRIARWTESGIDERYLYQGWNLTAIYQAGQLRPTNTFTWGKDLSGTLAEAGGIGGLLFSKRQDQGLGAWIYHYDGNGNITEVTDEKGKLLEQLRYDPFGNALDHPRLPENRWRFSTKPFDEESNLYYFGYRYYQPTIGRWMSRDPIEEKGGVNLYAMVGNNPIQHTDYLGMKKVPRLHNHHPIKFEQDEASGGRLLTSVLLSASDNGIKAAAWASSHLGYLIPDIQEVEGTAEIKVSCICNSLGNWVPSLTSIKSGSHRTRVQVAFDITTSTTRDIGHGILKGRARAENMFSGTIPFVKYGVVVPFLGDAADTNIEIDARWSCFDE